MRTEPCSTCGRPVHHICANDIAPNVQDISLRYCSYRCLPFRVPGSRKGRERLQMPLDAIVVDLTTDTMPNENATVVQEPRIGIKVESDRRHLLRLPPSPILSPIHSPTLPQGTSFLSKMSAKANMPVNAPDERLHPNATRLIHTAPDVLHTPNATSLSGTVPVLGTSIERRDVATVASKQVLYATCGQF
jgi:hypothetical protein